MGARIRCSGVTCAVVLVAACAAPEAFAASKTTSGESIAKALRSGQAVVLDGRTIVGPFRLSSDDVVRSVFKCRDCTFTGPVSAADVVFERTFDVSGATFERTVDFRGAIFRGPALFRAEHIERSECGPQTQTNVFEQPVDFSLAVFENFASFAAMDFNAPVTFRDARFSDTTFLWTCFRQGSSFDDTSFRGATLFGDSTFQESGSFVGASFRGRADFARAKFEDGAKFRNARFSESASFLAAQFYAKSADEVATFQSVSSVSDLNFTFANFAGELATFSNLVSSAALNLRDAEFHKSQIAMDRLQVGDLVLDVDAVKQVDEGTQEPVLRSIEESAKAREDLATANDAHYELQVLESKQRRPFWRALDVVFYRGVAGYLVRPLHPIIVLTGLVALAAVLRMVSARRRSRPRPLYEPPRWRRWSTACGEFLTCFFETFAIAGPRSKRNPSDEFLLHHRVEVIVYRLLLVCALLGLASSNPTLREMVDTLL